LWRTETAWSQHKYRVEFLTHRDALFTGQRQAAMPTSSVSVSEKRRDALFIGQRQAAMPTSSFSVSKKRLSGNKCTAFSV
jgi:hypothetical protein